MRGLRLIQADLAVQRHLNKCYFNYSPYATNKYFLGKLRKTRVPCSCYMCGNPRRIFGNGKNGKTFKEQKNDCKDMQEIM